MQKLYYANPYVTEFEAEILGVEPYGEGYAVILNKTAFYPEGGGQPSDTGYINDTPVLQVIEEQGTVLHIVDSPLPTGTAKCRVDWDRRFDHMQQHTGQHIVSASFYKLFEGVTDSFHLGRDIVSIEIGIDSFDEAMAAQVEDLANSKVFADLPVKTYMTDKAGAAKLPLRKQPKVESDIRIVEIQGLDFSPCGGTHVFRTGEVGLIKLLGWEKCKGGHRITFICGNRALKDYRAKTSIMSSLGAKLSARQDTLEEAFDKVVIDLKEYQKLSSALNMQLLRYESEELLKNSKQVNGTYIVDKVFEERSFGDIKTIAQNIIQEPSHVALFVCRNEALQVLFSRSDDVKVDMNNIMKPFLNIINGKGGGSPKAAQGGGSKIEAAGEFLAAAVEKLKEQL